MTKARGGPGGGTQLPPDGKSSAGAGRADKIGAARELVLPSITVDLVHLFSRDEPLVELIRMPVWMMLKSRPDFAGELEFSTDNILALANFVGITDLECWQLLAKSIMHVEPVNGGGVSPLLTGHRPGTRHKP